jgi:hypothetical protein
LLLALYWSAKLLLFNCLYCNMKWSRKLISLMTEANCQERCCTVVPEQYMVACPKSTTINTTNADYFSVYYTCFGLIVQAVCDASCKCVHLEVAPPGYTNNVRAYRIHVQL